MHFYLSNEPKKVICFNPQQSWKLNFKKFLSQFILHFVEMHNFYIMWLYALRFVTYKISVDAFSVLLSKLLIAKLSLFAFGATFVEWH